MKKIKLNIQMFAVSKSTTFEETNVSIENNTSTLKITIKFSPNNDSTWFSSKTLSCTCNGVKKTANVSLSTGGSVSKTFTFDSIAHETDGSKTVAWSWTITTGTSVLGTLKDSGNRTLQTIPRASSIDSISTGTSPYYPTIKWTPKNANFKYQVVYSYTNFSLSSSIISPNQTTQYTYNGLLASNNLFKGTSETEIYATATLYTFQNNGTTQVGNPATATFKVTLSSGVTPTTTISNIEEASATMISKNWGVYVQGKSKIKFDVTVSGVQPLAPSVNTTITTNNQTFNLSGYTTKTFTTNEISASSISNIYALSTDSRQRTNDDGKYIGVVAYSNPDITTAKAKRVNSSNVAADNGTFLNISFSGSISPVSNGSANKNNNYFKVGFREKGSSDSYTYKTLVNNNKSTYSVPNTYTNYRITDSGWSFAANKSYEIVFEATDSFTTTRQTVYIESEGDLLNFNANGRAMAIGKVSEATGTDELFEVDMPTTLYKPNQLVLGSYNAHYVNNSSDTGFVKAMQIVIKATYIDTPLIFNVLGRANHWATYKVQFAGVDSTDPNLNAFTIICDNGNNFNAYIKKISTSTWGVYVYVAGWARTEITNLQFTPRHDEKLTITYPFDDFTATRPTSGITNASYEVLMCNIRNIYQENKDDENGYTFYPQGTSTNSTGNNGLYRTTGLTVYTKKGTTTTDGTCGLQLGLSYASGTDGNKKGEVRLFTLGTGSNYIEPATSHSSTYYNYLPTHSGTLQVQPINLYYNADGTSGTVTLSETAANYKYIEIFWRYSDNATRGSLKLQAPNNRKFQITANYDNGTYLYTIIGTYSVSGTSITVDSQIRWRFRTDGNATRTTGATNISIYRVDGIRTN